MKQHPSEVGMGGGVGMLFVILPENLGLQKLPDESYGLYDDSVDESGATGHEQGSVNRLLIFDFTARKQMLIYKFPNQPIRKKNTFHIFSGGGFSHLDVFELVRGSYAGFFYEWWWGHCTVRSVLYWGGGAVQ